MRKELTDGAKYCNNVLLYVYTYIVYIYILYKMYYVYDIYDLYMYVKAGEMYCCNDRCAT